MAVEVEHHDAVTLVRLNRPEAANALDPATAVAVGAAFKEATDDAAVRAVILTGAGDRVFCAGMDLKAFAEGQDMTPVGEALELIPACPKPVIAAVNGAAVAGGFELMMRCDLAVVADHARFGIPEVKRGLLAAGGGTRLPSRIPLAVALELGLTGELIDAGRARELGLVNRVVPAADVVSTALELAHTIAANGPLAVQATKQLMKEEIGAGDTERIHELAAPVMTSADAMEGATAFAEKRTPNWTGT
jgi:enoyl-CoA hydratase